MTSDIEAAIDLWRAVSNLANLWSGMPVVRRLASDLPRNAAQRADGIPGRLQELEAGGAGISARPLRVASIVRARRNWPSSPMSQGPPDPGEWQQWFRAAAAVEIAHQGTLSWLRSRMPRYPDLPVPQLAPGTPLRADETGYSLLWPQNEPLAGLQFQSLPPQIAQTLQANAKEQRQIANATQVLGAALERTAEWHRLGSTADSLAGPTITELRQARKTLSERLSSARVNDHSRQALGRSIYRTTILNDVVAALSGPAKEYAYSFDEANRVLVTAASDVFSQLTAYGQPATSANPKNIDHKPGSHIRLVSFTQAADDGSESTFPFLEMGQLMWVDNVLIHDCIQITSGQHSFGLAAGEEQRYTGTVLAGTGRAWSH